MLKARSFKTWRKLNEAWRLLSEDYYFFPKAYKKVLEDNYNIDSGLIRGKTSTVNKNIWALIIQIFFSALAIIMIYLY